MKYVITIVLFLLFLCTLSYAGDVSLAWDCNTCVDDGVTGFRLYYGGTSHLSTVNPVDITTPAPYEGMVDINNAAARSITITFPKGMYYFRMVAFAPDSINPSVIELSRFTDEEVSQRVKPTHPRNLKSQ